MRGAADSCLLVEQLLDVICKDLDQGSMSSTSMPRWVFLMFINFVYLLLDFRVANNDCNELSA